jgi:hypothetical protein
MQFQFAEVATEIEAARLLTYNAARLKEQGQNFTKQAAMAKWYSSVVAQKAAGSAIEWAGGVGFTRETGIEKYWRDSKSALSFPSLFFASMLTFLSPSSSFSRRHLRGHFEHPAAHHRQAPHEGTRSLSHRPSTRIVLFSLYSLDFCKVYRVVPHTRCETQ